MKPLSHKNKQQGFTLMELLLAVSIFALISIGSYRMLSLTINGQELGEDRLQRIQDLGKVLLLLEQGLTQALPRSIRDGNGDIEYAFIGEDRSVEFSHGGWFNPMQYRRGEVRRSRFEFFTETDPEKGVVDYWRILQWPVLDRTLDSQAEEMFRIEVDNAELRYLSQDYIWQANWPVSDNNNTKSQLPLAVEIILDTRDFGEVRRLLPLGGMLSEPMAESAQGKADKEGGIESPGSI